MFERLTDRARRVLVLAQDEARDLGHGFIGTEHILLGLIHEGEGLAAKALGQLGISLDAVRDRVEETIGRAGSAPIASPPFTPRAKKVLELSLREALQLGHNYIGTEHILLGLVREGEGVAAKTLESLGADLPRVREKVVQLLSGYERGSRAAAAGGGNDPRHERARAGELRAVPYSADPGRPPISPGVRSVLALARREAADRGHSATRSGHVLLGLLRDEKGIAASVLERLGVDVARVREEVIEHFDEP